MQLRLPISWKPLMARGRRSSQGPGHPIGDSRMAIRMKFPSRASLWLIAASAAALAAVPASSPAATLRVGPSETYQTVRAASQAVQNGDTVLVDAGIYSADVTTWNASNIT